MTPPSRLQAASRSAALAIQRRSVIIHRNLFQPSLNPAASMMLLLIGKVFQNPWEMLLPEAYNPIAALPLELCHSLPLVHLVGASALQVADQIADANVRFDVDCQMEMGGGSANTVQE